MYGRSGSTERRHRVYGQVHQCPLTDVPAHAPNVALGMKKGVVNHMPQVCLLPVLSCVNRRSSEIQGTALGECLRA